MANNSSAERFNQETEIKTGAEIILKPRTLDGWQGYFYNLYGLNNDIHLSGREKRLPWLNSAIRAAKVSVREDHDPEVIAGNMARILPRMFSLADTVKGMRVTDGMMMKYPEWGCVYCNQTPCNCPSRKTEPKLADPKRNSPQRQWNILDWQKHLQNVYGERNARSGEDIMGHLAEEIAELMEIEHDELPKFEHSTLDLVRMLQLEVSDGIARTITAANALHINLQDAVESRYFPGCSRCGLNPCNCRGISYKALT